MRVQARAWRRVGGIIWDRKLKKQLKVSVGGMCGTSLCVLVRNTCTDTETGEE